MVMVMSIYRHHLLYHINDGHHMRLRHSFSSLRSTMHQRQAHNTAHPLNRQTIPKAGQNGDNSRTETGSAQGMQHLADRVGKMAVRGSEDNGVSVLQGPSTRGMREGDAGDGSRGLAGREPGRPWGAAGRGMARGGEGGWRAAGERSFDAGERRDPRYINPREHRHNGHQNSGDSSGSYRSQSQSRDQPLWRQESSPWEGNPSPFETSARISPQNGGDARFAPKDHTSSNHFSKSGANGSARGRRGSPMHQRSAGGSRHPRDSAMTSLPRRDSARSVNPLPMDPATKFVPITQTIVVPMHLQHPFRLYEPGTIFDISASLNAESVTERHPSAEYLTMAQASPTEYYTRSLSKGVDPRNTRKLVVLDLNGALLVRSKRSTIPIENIKRQVYPRPFLAPFLAYMLNPARPLDESSDPFDPKEQEMRPYEAFVWSSAQPINVDSMIRSAFGKWGMPTSPRAGDRVMCERMLMRFERVESRAGRVLGVWTRNEMDLTRAQYGENLLVV